MALQIRRGTNADRLSFTPAEGELVYTTDSKRVYVGDGTTVGGIGSSVGIESVLADTSPQLGGNLNLNGQNIIGTGNINITGTITATGNINLGDASGDNINVAGSITTNLNPAIDSAVDIGSSVLRWRNGYFAGLTVDGQIDAVAVNSDIIADNSTVMVNVGTNVFTGNLTGNVTGNLTGNVTGNLTGTVDGSVVGDVQGSVFSDGSTLLVDGVNSIIPAENIVGNLFGATRVTITNDNADIITGGGISSTRIYPDGDPSLISLRKARGTIATPATVVAGDYIGQMQGIAFDGSSYVGTAGVLLRADPNGSVTAGVVPGQIELVTYNNTGAPITRAKIDSSGTFTTYGIHYGITSAPTGLPFYSLCNSNIPSSGARIVLGFSRGTFDTPLAVQSGDVLHRVVFRGYDGGAYRDTATIRGVVDGSVSSGVVPTKLEIQTTNTVGTTATAATFETDATVTISKALKMAIYANDTARDAALPYPEAGMIVFNQRDDSTGVPQFQGYDGSVWVDLH